MLAGPIFSREALTLPRQLSHYLVRSGYIAILLALMYTAGQAAFGWQQVRSLGELARFGSLVFQFFALVQLSLVLFFALLFASGRVAQEKDRRTLVLLLMTDMSDRELVLGKLFAGLLNVLVLVAVSLPVFAAVHLLGGVTLAQIGWTLAICGATALAAGGWGTLVGFWREKTFQTIAISVLGAILFLGVVEGLVLLLGDAGAYVGVFNPFRALWSVLSPLSVSESTLSMNGAGLGCVVALLSLALVLNGVATWKLRVWNPSRSIYLAGLMGEDDAQTKTRAKTRAIWDNPVIWREIRTRAYGNKVVLIKLAYLILAALVSYAMLGGAQTDLVLGMVPPAAAAFVGLTLLSLILINAQAVTALTSEKDAQTLELLLVTDLTAKEFIYGKLGGILWNTKELILVPLLLTGWFAWQGQLTLETMVYLVIGYLVLVGFAAMLGLHAGLSYDRSRAAIANSLGTMFFLFVGIFVFMMLLVEARSSFMIQFQSFLIFIGLGSIGLYSSLTHKNPSSALSLAAGILPFLTFYAITEFLLSGTLGVCLAISVAYGFTTLAMLIPAVSEFDVALGRSTLDKG